MTYLFTRVSFMDVDYCMVGGWMMLFWMMDVTVFFAAFWMFVVWIDNYIDTSIIRQVTLYLYVL